MTLTATNDESALTWGNPKREKRAAERQRLKQRRSPTQARLDWIASPPHDYHEALWETRSELTRHPHDYTDRDLRDTANRLLATIDALTDSTRAEESWGEDGEGWWTARAKLARLEGRWDAIASELQSRKRNPLAGSTSGHTSGPPTWLAIPKGSDPFLKE